MTFKVEITATALAEITRAFAWLHERSPAAAERWRTSLLAAVDSLATHPERCPWAPENDWYPGKLHQLLHGRRRRVYRILFEIRGDTVYVLRVRHGAQKLLDAEDW